MKRIRQATALIALAAISASATAASDGHTYVGLMGSYVIPDSIRDNDNGAGGSLLLGRTISPWLATELNAFGHTGPHQNDNGDDSFYGGSLDLRVLFGSERIGGFIIGGIGAIREEYENDSEASPLANLGIGMLLGSDAIQFRGEVRQYAIANRVSYPGETRQYDTRVNLGVQFAFLGNAAAAAIDSDGDGVIDASDLCPGTAPGTAVDSSGCPLSVDSDGDGVVDASDVCPGTPAGVLVDSRGCPPPAPPVVRIADEDGDGVPDEMDRCLHSPPGFKVDPQGCVIKQNAVIVLESVNFELDSTRLTRDARIRLDDVSAGLKGQPTMTVEIVGHTDSLGSEQYNLRLSQQRAEVVRAYLVDRGIDGRRLQVRGMGESKPIADNSTESGRAANRRVEFDVTSK
jgi:OOP family OmpA-OmpF porin